LLNKPQTNNQDGPNREIHWNVQTKTGQTINGNPEGTDIAGSMVSEN
jgi:hypothetical protein